MFADNAAFLHQWEPVFSIPVAMSHRLLVRAADVIVKSVRKTTRSVSSANIFLVMVPPCQDNQPLACHHQDRRPHGPWQRMKTELLLESINVSRTGEPQSAQRPQRVRKSITIEGVDNSLNNELQLL